MSTEKMDQIPLTLKCPVGGEEWPATSYKSWIDATSEVQRPGTIHIYCPAGHSFTLAKAMRGKEKMFTRKQATNLVANAQRLADKFHAARNFNEIEQVIKEARGEG